MNKTLICIPTYIEKDNIEALLERVREQNPRFDLLVVDDHSPDGTADSVKKIQQKDDKVFLEQNASRRGFGPSYKQGIQFALDHGYDFFIQMDADFSHHPKYLNLIENLLGTHDFVIGSRYTKSGGIQNWSILRRTLSRMANLYASLWLSFQIKDWTSGFIGWKVSVLKEIDCASLKSDGYSFLMELKWLALKRKFKPKETPIVFTDRWEEESKMNFNIILEAIFRVPVFRLQCIFRKYSELK